MKKKIILTLKILLTAAFLLFNAACQPVSDEAYVSALKATSSAPPIPTGEKTAPDPVESETTSGESSSAEITADEPVTETTVETTAEPAPAPADSEPVYSSPAVIAAPYGLCYNLTDGIMIYGKNIDEKMYPASITKLLTALVAQRNLPADFIFEVGNEIWQVKPGSSIAALKLGQKLNLDAMLTALLMPSGNDAALTIAVNVARQKAENAENMTFDELLNYFVGLMNEYVLEIELENSHFANPDGYHHDNHFSTLRDLLKICIASADNPIISSICAKPNANVFTESGEILSWAHHLPLLGNEEWGVEGLKTGYTDESLYSFAALAEFNGKRYITIVSGCASGEQRTEETKKLLAIARDGYHEETVSDYLEESQG